LSGVESDFESYLFLRRRILRPLALFNKRGKKHQRQRGKNQEELYRKRIHLC
jgi:hypothetical protein